MNRHSRPATEEEKEADRAREEFFLDLAADEERQREDDRDYEEAWAYGWDE